MLYLITFRLNIVLIVFVLNIVLANLYYFIFIVLFYFPFNWAQPGLMKAGPREAHFGKFVSHHARPLFTAQNPDTAAAKPAMTGPSSSNDHASHVWPGSLSRAHKRPAEPRPNNPVCMANCYFILPRIAAPAWHLTSSLLPRAPSAMQLPRRATTSSKSPDLLPSQTGRSWRDHAQDTSCMGLLLMHVPRIRFGQHHASPAQQFVSWLFPSSCVHVRTADFVFPCAASFLMSTPRKQSHVRSPCVYN